MGLIAPVKIHEARFVSQNSRVFTLLRVSHKAEYISGGKQNKREEEKIRKNRVNTKNNEALNEF